MASRQSDISRAEVSVLLPTKTTPSYEQRVIGKVAEIEGIEIEEFRGIPYGTVPARWQHAVLRDKLPEDIFYATKNGPRCPQPQEPNNSDFFQSHLDFPDFTESEFDCLHLFITRPSASALTAAGISATTKLPVYVYIHGGAYSFGAGTDPMWNPARLVKKSIELGTPIIVATINYRLHMFGFGAASELIARSRGGNFGLTDQRIAIRWVHQNIDAFGGNVDQVTVGGQSAGGSSSHAHILQVVFGDQEPLVQRAIIQSGAVGVLGPVSMHVADERWNAICAQLDAPDSSRLEYMMNVPADKIIKSVHDLGWMASPLVVDGFTISEKDGRWKIHLDGTENSDHAQPVNPAPIAVLIGDTDLEGTVHGDLVSKIKSFTQLQEILDQVKSREFLDKFYRLYNLQPDTPLPSLQEQILHFLSDLQFGYPVQLARDELIKSTARPTVVQSYRAKFGNPFPGPNHQKAQHCVDLIYIYDAFAEALRAVDKALPVDAIKNEALVERLQADWVRFIAGPATSSQDGLATIYNADKTTSTVDMAIDPEWVARKERFHLLAEYPIAAQQAMEALSGFGHSF